MLQLLDKNNNNSSTDEEVVGGGTESASVLFAATTTGLHLKQTTRTTRKRINITGVGVGGGGGCTRTWSTKARKIYHLVLLLMVFLGGSSVTQTNGDISPHYLDTPYSPPYFDTSTKRKVTAGIGQSALLHCRVRNLGDRAVSWIRKRDLHILTVGILTYTNDQRFQSLHTEGSDEWTLKVSSPQPRDSGTYECQVSTEPKISQAFRLNVVASRAKILGNSELYIKSGSNINLTCLTMQTSTAPSFIYWYKGKQLINYSQAGGAINVITDRQTRTSNLLIAKASPADNGNYTCSPSNSDSASVTVHVIKGEHSAAMHHEEGNISSIAVSTMDPDINKFHIVFGITTIFTINNLFLNFFRNENNYDFR